MKYLLNTLFVTSEDIYLSLDGENVVANRDKALRWRVSPPYPFRDYLLLLPWCVPCAHGCLCPAGCVPGLLYTARPFSGPSDRGELWKCAAPPGSVRAADDPGPCCRIAAV